LNADDNEDETRALLLPFFLPMLILRLLCLRFLEAEEEEEDTGDETPPARGRIIIVSSFSPRAQKI
jgi:hypothetical protein